MIINYFTRRLFLILFVISSNLCLMHTATAASPYSSGIRPYINKDDDYKKLMGLTAGIGKVRTDEKDEEGVLAYANAYMFWFNLSYEYQSYDNYSISNTYTGLGLGRYLQWQYGYGDEGYVIRLRSEFEIIGKFTVYIARERYRDHSEFDNYSAGIGYNF